MVATLALLAVVGTSAWTPEFPNPQVQGAPAEEPVSKVPSWPLWPGEGAPIRGTGDPAESTRWIFSLRAIDGIPVDRAKLRTTAAYSIDEALQVGLEWNPLANDLGPIANWRAIDETSERPALIFGTSSDHIGTSHGRAVYGTFSKDLEAWSHLPIAPYAGASFGTADDELVPIGGLLIRWAERFSTSSLYDGYNLHHMATWAFDHGISASAIAVDQDGTYYFGLALSAGIWGSLHSDAMKDRVVRTLLALPLLAALACTGPGAGRTDLVVLESSQFTWGAAAGLGWGSRLAPVLASLDGIPGVRETRVDHDGLYFLFALEPDASTWAVVESAREFLPDAHRPPPKKEKELVESYLSGATWLRSGDTKELSREEAHILARRHGQQAATFLGLDETKTKQMLRILDEETVAAFDRVHAAGGGLGPESRREFEIGTQRTIERCKAFLDPREIAGLEEYLTGLLAS